MSKTKTNYEPGITDPKSMKANKYKGQCKYSKAQVQMQPNTLTCFCVASRVSLFKQIPIIRQNEMIANKNVPLSLNYHVDAKCKLHVALCKP